MADKHLNNSWNRERNRLFCGYTMDENLRSMLSLEENLLNSTDSKTGIVIVQVLHHGYFQRKC